MFFNCRNWIKEMNRWARKGKKTFSFGQRFILKNIFHLVVFVFFILFYKILDKILTIFLNIEANKL
jgi:hypothetical protein